MINIIPVPKQMEEKDGFFNLDNVSVCCNDERLSAIADLLCETFDLKKSENGEIVLECNGQTDDSYEIDVTSSKIRVSGGEKGIFYAVSTLRQLENHGKIPCVHIKDWADFEIRGFYFDIGRGRVPKLETLFKLVDELAFYKINHLQLYVEHSFEYKGMEEVWKDKDPITREEIIAIDEYCKKNYIELVPSFALFGHLYEILRNPKFSHLCEIEPDDKFNFVDRMWHHTIDISNPESFELIKSMIDDVLPLFSSNKFNICCDETFDLGKGKSREYVEKIGTGMAYVEFVNKIAGYLQSKGKEVMLWGDIILKHPECIGFMRENLTMLNWNYSAEPSEENVETFKNAGVKQIVCPGSWAWVGTLNRYNIAIPNITKSADYAKKYGAAGILNTDWGDLGHVGSPEYSIPMLVLGAAKSWNCDADVNFSNISRMVFGDPDTLDMLIDASDLQVIEYRKVVADYYNIKNGRPLEESVTHTAEEYMTAISKLDDILKSNPEHYLALKGIQIMNKFGLCLLNNKAEDFTVEVDEYMSAYKEHWLKDYKHSELNRIVEFFYGMTEICMNLQ